MLEKKGIYKCEICGNIVSVIEAKEGDIICCGQPMEIMEEKTQEKEGKEKHVPVLEIEGDKAKVKIGSIPHPMQEEHHIEMIQIIRGDKIIAEKRLYPEDEPEAEFLIDDAEGIRVRELCNVHGLWTN